MEITSGCVVRSRAGHDKGRVYAVLSVKEGFAELADGELRKLARPKRKNVIHLACLGKIDTAEAVTEDHVLRKHLSSWR
ncbi:MAG: KOW domain-containing RNA-binding protein [Clostridia bacterium]|nr:KOW domain-containing RNA-binding protein [Clostridia bacterium]MBR5768504.1 KOW domain-containing RNA-binding protein [Clostridia bacterium]MBR5942087.1 KOW domain-containing RNA-binding protein [Clostridia bacterium]